MFAVGRQPERACRDSPNWIDATKRHFIAKQSGYEGPVPENIDSLGQDHPVVIFRKQHLGRYLTRLVTGALEMAKWLNTWIS